jgi:SAM-dependent methyltransferase
MKLNLGCQVHYFEGWVNQDIIGDDPNMRVDMVCDANTLPYENDTVDFIYAGHLVEHYYPDTLAVAVAEWKRVLRPGGKLVIVTPDCGSVFRDYADGKFESIEATWQQVYGRIYHYDRESERHHIAFDPTQLLRMVDSPSWTYATPMDFQRVPEELEPFMDAHISRGAYQLGVILTKSQL